MLLTVLASFHMTLSYFCTAFTAGHAQVPGGQDSRRQCWDNCCLHSKSCGSRQGTQGEQSALLLASFSSACSCRWPKLLNC